MKVAIPIHGTRVSPLFDTACHALMVELIDGREVGREILTLPTLPVAARVFHLANEGAEVLICGGISRLLSDVIEGSGI
ncbi:NifB/NifX family molybdenum-iron cluster-binding protein, partial [candidate division KSB1 bacterium]